MQRGMFRRLLPHDAEDLVQATSEILLRRAKSQGDWIQNDHPNAPWQTIRQAMLDAFREQIFFGPIQHNRRRVPSIDYADEWDFSRLVSAIGNPMQSMDLADIRLAVEIALSSLRSRDRSIVEAYYLHDLNQADIAAREGLTPARICQILSRSITTIRGKVGLRLLRAAA